MNWAYALFVSVILIAPLIGVAVYPKSIFPKLKPMVGSILISAVIFWLWDVLVTDYFWRFNLSYILGFWIYNLPIEEILFFLVIPFSMLVLWVNFIEITKSVSVANWIRIIIFFMALLFMLISLNSGMWYTASVFLSLILVVVVDYILKQNLFLISQIYWFGLITIVFIAVFNNFLTTLPVVIYNQSVKSNLLIHTMPAEDIVYGVSLISLTLVLYEFLKKNLFMSE